MKLHPLGWAIVALAVATTACSGGESATTPPVVQETTPAPSAPATSSTATTTTSSSTTSSTTTTSTTTTTVPPSFFAAEDRVNILLLGSDAGVGRIGTRTDTIILVSLDPITADAVMLSVPRNLTEAPLPEGMGVWGCNCFPDIITHLWANGEWYPDAFPGEQAPSVNALKAAIGGVFEMEIDYYAKVELAGFVAVVDALGGVTIEVPQRIVDTQYPHENGGTVRVVIEEGTQELDGHLALAYGRIRRGSGDFARMHRQRCLIGSMLQQIDLSAMLDAGPELLAALVDNIETDLPIEALPDLAALLSEIDIDRFASLRITSHKYGSSGHAGYQIYDLEQIREDAAALIADPTTVLDTQDGAGLDDMCTRSFD